MPRRALLGALALGVPALFVAGTSLADEVGIEGAADGLALHDAGETLERYCSRDAEGRLWFQIQGGARFELITSTDDPDVANPGDGSFHPFEEAEVRLALGQVRYPLAAIHAEVFILPYPRRAALRSAAGRELILLSPGVRPLSPTQQHAELVHELGHVVQYALMPDGLTDRWLAYRRLRGILDENVYSAASPHADRPHEIFAEDFRALFGGPLARESGTIENSRILPPASVAGLDRFFVALARVGAPELPLMASRNPARGGLGFSKIGGAASPLDLFDGAGRRMATLEPRSVPGAVEWRWDGRDRAGRPVTGRVVFARVRGSAHDVTRVTILP